MSIESVQPREPRRPLGPRDPGDAWVVTPSGRRFWGRYGAAGLLLLDPDRGVLLQHRAQWSHYGGTWAVPGGARRKGESALDAALREAHEEADVPRAAVRVRMTSVLDLGFWSYTTVVADQIAPFEARIADAESLELAWADPHEVVLRRLHPGFAGTWRKLQPYLGQHPRVIVDALGVIGEAASVQQLLDRLEPLVRAGLPGPELDLGDSQWFPQWTILTGPDQPGGPTGPEGEQVRVQEVLDPVSAIEEELRTGLPGPVLVITDEDSLQQRARALGGQPRPASWLVEQLRPLS